MNGLKLAALYSYPPSRLGFCGKKIKNTSEILNNFIVNKNKSKNKVKKTLSGFEAAFPYLKLIAKANKIKDPFNSKVVEALWLGNKLLENIRFKDFKKMILTDFVKLGLLSKKQALKRISKLKPPIYPHHSFHVLVFGPVTGIKFKEKMYDLCKISAGKVKHIYSQKTHIYGGSHKILIEYKPLKIKNNKFYLSKKIKKQIYWKKNFVPSLKLGDVVSFHWALVCQKILARQQQNLEKYTILNIKKANPTVF